VFDNVSRAVDSASLCAGLTAETFEDRLLGQNMTVTVLTTVAWFMTGNHLECCGDLTTGVLLCKLDPELENPQEREFGRDITAYIEQHRPELLAAALTHSARLLQGRLTASAGAAHALPRVGSVRSPPPTVTGRIGPDADAGRPSRR
jgi:hypothetical protein